MSSIRQNMMLLSFILLVHLINPSNGLTDERADIDGACRERLEGTTSLETCLDGCMSTGMRCGLIISYKAEDDDQLLKNLDCYGCRKEICADYGWIDHVAKLACDANPAKKSVVAPPLPDGTPCFQCVDVHDKCSTKFAGSVVKPTCLASCPKGTHKCKKAGKVDKEDCFRCTPKLPLPPPPKTCKKMKLLVAGQCKACKDPMPMCVPKGVVAVNGPCFTCVKKPKITCSEFGLQTKCQCGPDGVKKNYIKTKVTPQGIKLQKECCECVKKPEECLDINLYTQAECKTACQKPGHCRKTSQSKKGDCYDCISPISCEEEEYSTTCNQCYAQDFLCRDVTTVKGVKCKECYKGSCTDVGFENDCQACVKQAQGCRSVSPLNAPDDWICKECFGSKDMCEDGGLPGNCPGTCSDGQLCINVADCHMCLNVKRVEVTWMIIIIETPLGRVVLDGENSLDNIKKIKPMSLMALATANSAFTDIGKQAPTLTQVGDVFSEGATSSGTTEEIADILKERFLNNNRVFSESCFDDLDVATPVKKPPVPASENSLQPFGEDNERNIVLNGPVITCGAVNGESYLVIYSASGVPIQTIRKGQLMEDPNIIVDALTRAANSSLSSLKLSKSIWNQSYETKPTFSDLSEDEVTPNDPFYKMTKKKKKKLLGIVGSNKRPKVSIGSIIRMGNKEMGAGNARMNTVQKAEVGITDQWGIQRIGYLPKNDPNSAWNVYEGNHKNVLIAVIDSGLDFNHPDGPQYIWTNLDEIPNNGIDDDGNGYVDDIHGWNFYQNNNDLTDIKGHGTLVAGIIAAKTNNGFGIAGINPGAVIMPLKVVEGRAGITRSIHIFQAIHYAVNRGAQIINISLGGKGVSKLEQNAINYAYANGVFVVIASGNNGNYLPDIGPAAARRVTSIGSLDFDGTRATITSWGPNNGLIAPGELIASLQSKDAYQEGGQRMPDLAYYRMSGSSFSAPMVAATASLLLSGHPNLTPTQLEDILMGSATDMGRAGWDGQTGSGLLNAKRALENYSDKFLTVKITDFKINRDKRKKLESVDVYGTIRGDVKNFIVEVGKGRRAKRFKKVAGPFKVEADHNWITQILKDDIRGSKEWIVQIKATDRKGRVRTAGSLLLVK